MIPVGDAPFSLESKQIVVGKITRRNKMMNLLGDWREIGHQKGKKVVAYITQNGARTDTKLPGVRQDMIN
jgi:hypothetical protein